MQGPKVRHPIASLGPDAVARESPAVPRGGAEGGKVRSPGTGRKKGSGSPNCRNYEGQTARIALLGAGEGVGAGERREGAWVGRLGDYGGQTVQIRLVSPMEGARREGNPLTRKGFFGGGEGGDGRGGWGTKGSSSGRV